MDLSGFYLRSKVLKKEADLTEADLSGAGLSARRCTATACPEQILTEAGKVVSGRFGPARGEVLFDRICRKRHPSPVDRTALADHHRQGRALPQNPSR
jgi:hypothetical protein